MALSEFWQQRENQWNTLEKRCRELFEKHGSNYSYSRTEINMLRTLKLLPNL